ncbi:DUF1540 domain-containing protein [Heliorestis acidaminivorans]|uniref:DUF1540 domain-containing protein n=1 Tax=Heliorestis acidaminivorans TaxID=553427 RepID=A0A6I0F2W5_9FIRM|nr:DUF1540 domain-containing protein [Heliorestis acidaminivorans]
MSTIKCNVEECYYNEKEHCKASTVQVRSQFPNYITSVSDDTACETFVPKVSIR